MRFWLWLKNLFSRTPKQVWYILVPEQGKTVVAGEVHGTEEEANEEAGTVVVNHMFRSGAFAKGVPVHSHYHVVSKEEWERFQKDVS